MRTALGRQAWAQSFRKFSASQDTAPQPHTHYAGRKDQMIARYIAGQFRKPTGLLGRLIGNGMARGNAAEQTWTLSLLQIQPADHILEIAGGPSLGKSVNAVAVEMPLIEYFKPCGGTRMLPSSPKVRMRAGTNSVTW